MKPSYNTGKTRGRPAMAMIAGPPVTITTIMVGPAAAAVTAVSGTPADAAVRSLR